MESSNNNNNINSSLTNKQKIVTSLISGSLAGAAAKTSIAPLDRAKINFQVNKQRFSYKDLINFFKNDISRHGIFNLWRGNSATMVRVMPSAAINFASHEQYKRILNVDNEKNSKTPFFRFLAGSLAGLTAASVTYPLDLARARMAVTQAEQYQNLIQIFKQTLRTEKITGLYKGFTISVIGALPYAGSVYFVYESLKIHHNETYKTVPNPFERIMYGAAAGAVGQTASYPFDILRRRMQTAALINRNESNLNSIQLCSKIIREEGFFKGMYKGLSLNWIKGPIAAGVGFCTFDILQLFTRKNFYYK